MVEADGGGPGFMGRGDDLCKEGPVQEGPEPLLAGRILRHDRQRRTDGYRGAMTEPGIVGRPIECAEGGGGDGPQRLGEQRS